MQGLKTARLAPPPRADIRIVISPNGIDPCVHFGPEGRGGSPSGALKGSLSQLGAQHGPPSPSTSLKDAGEWVSG